MWERKAFHKFGCEHQSRGRKSTAKKPKNSLNHWEQKKPQIKHKDNFNNRDFGSMSCHLKHLPTSRKHFGKYNYAFCLRLLLTDGLWNRLPDMLWCQGEVAAIVNWILWSPTIFFSYLNARDFQNHVTSEDYEKLF